MKRLITADYVLNDDFVFKKSMTIELDNDLITRVYDFVPKSSDIEYYPGVLIPAFVNTHCHLELSHLQNAVKDCDNLPNFVEQIVSQRINHSYHIIKEQIDLADKELFDSGVQAVGDIANKIDSIYTKQKSKIFYHTFIEIYGFTPEQAEERFSTATYLYNQFKNSGLRVSLVPHAPYSCCDTLLRKLKEYYTQNNDIFTIHLQESDEENKLFRDESNLFSTNFEKQGIKMFDFKKKYSDSVDRLIEYLPTKRNLLPVHNIYMDNKKISNLMNSCPGAEIYPVLCPESNLFIENKLPNIPMLQANGLKICIGTDSKASSKSFDVLKQLKIINNKLPNIAVNELIKWATINGAMALNINDKFGSLRTGKKPGICLLDNASEVVNNQLENTTLKRIT